MSLTVVAGADGSSARLDAPEIERQLRATRLRIARLHIGSLSLSALLLRQLLGAGQIVGGQQRIAFARVLLYGPWHADPAPVS